MADVERILGSFAQCRDRVAVTVIDNSPTPALRAAVECIGAVYLFPGRNLGFGAGHNLAMRDAIEQSTYHLVCNPDIVCDNELLSELGMFMNRNPEVGLVMPRVLYPGGQEQRLCKRLPTPADLLVRRFTGRPGEMLMRKSLNRYELRDVDLNVTREAPSLSGCFMFLRSAVLRQVGLFDPRFFMYMEDVDLCRRVGAVAHTVFYPHVSVTHGYAKGSYRDMRLLRFHMTSAVRYFNKWGWFHDPQQKELNRRTRVWTEARQLELSGTAKS